MIENTPPSLSNSLWTACTEDKPAQSRFLADADTDIAIIGGGVTGLSAALHLAEAGQNVRVLEAQSPGWGASGRNGGQLNPGLHNDPEQVVRDFGPEMGARMLALSSGAPAYTMALIARLGLQCDAVMPGWIQPGHTTRVMRTLADRARQWAAHGVDLHMLDAHETAAILGTDIYQGALLHPNGANLHPLNYTRGLAKAAQRAGAVIHTDTPVTDITREGSAHVLHTPQATLRARRVIVCTNGYTGDIAPPLGRTLVPVVSAQVATAPLPAALLEKILPQRHAASDTRRVMVYYKRDGAGRLLMGGRGDYNETTTLKLQENLRQITRQMFPELRDTPFDYAWGGNVAMTIDHYPHLSPLGPDMLGATGYNGRGMALATAMGRVLRDWAMGAPAHTLDFPLTPARPIPFHWARKPAVRAAVKLYQLQDALRL
ncbi:FAD-binding oxidoreductase [Rhodobacteraceae bacterium]|nr:FAD-binding oxidoreductase [Paracoccaceae bacterium]